MKQYDNFAVEIRVNNNIILSEVFLSDLCGMNFYAVS